jgi:ElaB/YqjD/DUF883 family membrane-anchored ribosome-binding protein
MSGDEDSIDSGNISDQLAGLRAEVDRLTNERIRPAFDDATTRVKEQADAVAARVRDQPIAAVLIAAGIGFLVGRAVR